MKYIVASDIHGNAEYLNYLKERIDEQVPDKVILLGDIYARDYTLINGILRAIKAPVLRVDGNCDAFGEDVCPVVSEGAYHIEPYRGRRIMFTHGHFYNKYNAPSFLADGDILIYGHTHVPAIEERARILYVNVGSVGRPRDGSPHTYATVTEKDITVLDVEYNETVRRIEI